VSLLVRALPSGLLAAVVASVTAPTVAENPARVSPLIDAVLEQSARTGRPVLAVCGTAGCEACVRLRRRLAADPVTAQFLRIDLTIDATPEWRGWQAFAGSRAWSSPQVFVVRADGKILLSGRAQSDMSEELRTAFEETGVPLTEQEAVLAAKLVEKATSLAETGDRSGALREIAPVLGARSYARAAVAARELGATLAGPLKLAVDSAPPGVADDAAGIDAALAIVSVVRDCHAVAPDLVRAAVAKIAALKKDPASAEVVRQAEQILAAMVAARTSASRGRALLEKIVAECPDGGAAEVARARLEKLPASARPSS
jgi:hypothetical protein